MTTYPTVKANGHPRAFGRDRIYSHTAAAEAALGRFLPDRAEVHVGAGGHLVICEDHAYNMLLHTRRRALRASGDPAKRLCMYCHRYDSFPPLSRRDNRIFHPSCEGRPSQAKS